MTLQELERREQNCERRMNEYWDMACDAVGAERRTYHAWFVREHEAWCRAIEMVTIRKRNIVA